MKLKYINSKNKIIIFKKTILKSFFKVFFLFLFAMLPIALHSIIPLFITKFNYSGVEGGISGSLVAQAINYSQPILFFSINIIILIIVQVSFLIKKYYEKENFEKNKRKIIDTGMYVTLLLSFSVAILFTSIMMVYSEFAIGNSGTNSSFLKQYSRLYIAIMAIYILFAGMSAYFIFMMLESDIKMKYIVTMEFLFSILDIFLATLFLLYVRNISPVVRISLGTLISTIIKFIIMGIIYKIKVATWQFREMKFSKFFGKEIFAMSWMLSVFMLTYSFNIIIQMSLINTLSRNTHSYIYYVDGESLIIISRIIIFSILNLLVIIPKSLGRAINLSSIRPKEGDINLSMNQFKVSRKYNYYGMAVFIIISLIIFFILNNFVDVIFKNQTWISYKIPLEEQLTIPFEHNADITYLDVIKKFIWNGFLISIFAQAIINFTINMRVFIYFNYEKNIPLFIWTIIIFFITYGLGSYFLGVYFQKYFPGMIGFSLAQLFYGILSIGLTTFYYFKITNKHINKKLETLKQEKLLSIFKYKNIFQYFKDRNKKIKICVV